ncbi:MAG: hypothetical protein H6Q61_999 [Firmicutes bacterium]|nr:hypothetical protein [Bacillota bacterium]
MPQNLYHAEFSGSLTPQLEGAPSSLRHEPRLTISPEPLTASPLPTPVQEKGAPNEPLELSTP